MYCGPRCLVYIERRQGRELSLKQASELCETTRAGTYPEGLVNALRKLGYRAKLQQNLTWGKLREFLRKKRIIVVDWWTVLNAPEGPVTPPDGHWSVVESMTRNSITLYDPDPEQVITLPKSFWMAHWFDYNQDESGRHDMLQSAVVAYWPQRGFAQ